TQEFKTLGMDDYLWVQALFNHEELERLRGQEPTDPHQRFLWRIIRMGVIDPEAGEKVMDASTRSMRHSSAIGMRLWKMWSVRKLDLSQSCFSLNFYFYMFLRLFPSMFPLLTYSQSFLFLSADHPRHSRQRRSKNSILLVQEQSKNHFTT